MQTAEQIIVEAKRWQAIYPSYIDSKIKCSQGRRLGVSHCVASPQLLEISDALRKLGLQHVVEGHKFYSKDILKAGRIKVKILNEEKKAFNPLVPNKHTLLKQLAALIRGIPNRKVVQDFPTQTMEVEQPKKKKAKR